MCQRIAKSREPVTGARAALPHSAPRGRPMVRRVEKAGADRYAAAPTAYAALIAALSQNSWKCFALPSRNVNTIATSEFLGPGDFLHADAGTDHGELWSDDGAQVLLVVPPEDY